jgi:hypothetical protein
MPTLFIARSDKTENNESNGGRESSGAASVICRQAQFRVFKLAGQNFNLNLACDRRRAMKALFVM